MIIFNNYPTFHKIPSQDKRHPIIKPKVKRSRRKSRKNITESNKEFLRALGFKI